MKFLTLTLAAVLTLAFSLAAPVQASLAPEDKCIVFVAKAQMNFSKCLKVANLLEAKGKTPDRTKCSDKYDQAIAKAKTKFINDKLNVTAAECGLEQASTDAAKALDIVSAGEDLGDYGLDSSALAGTAADITSDNQAICEAANGTWGSDTCTAAAGPVQSGPIAEFSYRTPERTFLYIEDSTPSPNTGQWIMIVDTNVATLDFSSTNLCYVVAECTACSNPAIFMFDHPRGAGGDLSVANGQFHVFDTQNDCESHTERCG